MPLFSFILAIGFAVIHFASKSMNFLR